MTDASSNEPEIMIVKKDHRQRYLVSILLISVLVVLVIFGVLYATGQVKIKGLPASPFISPSPSPSNVTASPPPLNLQSCDVKKDGNPLIDDLLTLNDGSIFGTYLGNVLKTSPGQALDERNILLISPKGDQQFSFTIKKRSKLVYNSGTFKELALTDIKPMDTLLISFSCGPKENLVYKIESVAVTSP